MSLKLDTENFDSMVEMKMSHRSMNIQAKTLLGPPLGKGDTGSTRKHRGGSLEQKTELVFFACRGGLGLRNINGFRCSSTCRGT